MNKTIELSTGKLIDLSRFVALIPDAETAENHQYLLILEGYPQPINLNSLEASSIKKHLQVDNEKKHNGTWDREEQIRLNQPKLKKLKEIIERKKQEQPSAEKAAYFESFKKTMDAHRPEGQKLYEH
jgi:type II secretory pathway component PulJ